MKWPETNNQIKSEINIAPLVDVMLVLLIVFMLASPYLYESVKVNLPSSKGVSKKSLNPGQVILTFDQKGSFFLGDEEVSRNILYDVLKAELEGKSDKTIYLKADYALSYGVVAEFMSDFQTCLLYTSPSPRD